MKQNYFRPSLTALDPFRFLRGDDKQYNCLRFSFTCKYNVFSNWSTASLDDGEELISAIEITWIYWDLRWGRGICPENKMYHVDSNSLFLLDRLRTGILLRYYQFSVLLPWIWKAFTQMNLYSTYLPRKALVSKFATLVYSCAASMKPSFGTSATKGEIDIVFILPQLH